MAPWRGGTWYTARAEGEDDLYFNKWAFDNADRSTVDNFSLAALRKVTYSTFGTRTKPGLLENFSTLESQVGVLSKRLEMLERTLDGFCVEDVVAALERLDSIENTIGGRSRRLDKLETDGAKLQRSILMLGGKIEDLDKSLKEGAASVNDLSYGQLLSKVVRLEVVVNNNAMFTSDRLASVAQSVDGLFEHVHVEYPSQSERLRNLELTLEKLKNFECSLGTLRSDIGARVEKLENSMLYAENQLKVRIETISSSIPEVPKIIDAIRTAVTPDIVELARRVQDLEQGNSSGIEECCFKLDDLQGRVESLESTSSERERCAEEEKNCVDADAPDYVAPYIFELYEFLKDSASINPGEWVKHRIFEKASFKFRILAKMKFLSLPPERIDHWALLWLNGIGDLTVEEFSAALHSNMVNGF